MGDTVRVERDGFTLRLETLVRGFAAECGYGKPIVVSGAYHVYEKGSERVEYPYANEPGCYVFVANRKQVLYVGKGSRTIGGRIWSHIGRSGKGRDTARFPNAERWLKEAQPHVTVYSLAVPKEQWWLALALEGYLTEKLLPHKARV